MAGKNLSTESISYTPQVTPIADNPVSVPERELEGDKKLVVSEPSRIRCTLCD